VNALLFSLIVTAEPALQLALERASAVPGATIELISWKAPQCTGRFEVSSVVDASGRVPVRVRGNRCDDWGWATVRLTATTAELTHDVKLGESLDGAWALKTREVKRGVDRVTDVPPNATANRPLRVGQPLTLESIRVGPPAGTPITVRVKLGGIAIEERGTATSCTGGLVCAMLPQGKRVRGTLEDGVLIVSAEGDVP
jgi:flagella basal body P-ring formation protein FlgA